MVDVITQIIIKCPQSRVFGYASNLDNAPEWYVNIKSVEWRTPKPLTLGSQIAFKAQFLDDSLSMCMKLWNYYLDKNLSCGQPTDRF